MPEQVLTGMLACRSEGLSFEESWARVVGTASTTGKFAVRLPHDTVQRRQWLVALAATREEWRAAWNGAQTAFSEAVAMVGDVDFSAPAGVRGAGGLRIVHASPHPAIVRHLANAA